MKESKARGLRMKKRMDELKITISMLAKHCFVSDRSVYNWLNGKGMESKYVEPICGMLQITSDYLRTGRNE